MRPDGPLKETIDHIIPISRGGADTVDNICLSCLPCNLAKHAELPDEFLKRKDRPGMVSDCLTSNKQADGPIPHLPLPLPRGLTTDLGGAATAAS
jgi:hypothetical protein